MGAPLTWVRSRGRVDRRTRSRRGRQECAQADQVVRCRGEGHDPIDEVAAPVQSFGMAAAEKPQVGYPKELANRDKQRVQGSDVAAEDLALVLDRLTPARWESPCCAAHRGGRLPESQVRFRLLPERRPRKVRNDLFLL